MMDTEVENKPTCVCASYVLFLDRKTGMSSEVVDDFPPVPFATRSQRARGGRDEEVEGSVMKSIHVEFAENVDAEKKKEKKK